ncbi:hypothetical protein T492DRAFT_849500 [Pavlovales sp. CCMP2436]|nr:hypothetical protein T492DRAFT_849500 [Pavlovales sp. CCMP2436]
MADNKRGREPDVTEVIDLESEEPEAPASRPRHEPASRLPHKPASRPGAQSEPILLEEDDTPVARPAAPPAAGAARPPGSNLERRTLAGGVLNRGLLGEIAAIVQQCNSIGCDGRGLSQEISDALPYGCPYRVRGRAVGCRFAAPDQRAAPGTIDARADPLLGGATVINLFAQWEMGAPLKYNRVPPPRGVRDSKPQRAAWFKECLDQVSLLRPLPASIAFPENIGCGLGGGDWGTYERLVIEFAKRNPDVRIIIVKRADEPAGGERGRGGGRGGGSSSAGQPSVANMLRRG